MSITIKSSGISAQIRSLGAQLTSIQNTDGLEYLWQGDAQHWSGQAPVLFPIVGTIRNGKTEIEGKTYEMKRHGFARNMEFQLLEQQEDRAVFSLRANEETREMYPFDFELQIIYRVEGCRLTNEYVVINHDSRQMPFVVGGHPAFNCPITAGENFEDYVVEFEKEETADCPSVNMSTGLIDFGNCRRVLDGERAIPMRHDVFYKDALIFDSLKSRKVKLYSKKSGKGVEMDFPGFDYLGVGSAANDGPFVALEPWTGCATCEDEDDVMEHKRNMTKLQPGEKFSVAFSVTLL